MLSLVSLHLIFFWRSYLNCVSLKDFSETINIYDIFLMSDVIVICKFISCLLYTSDAADE